MGGPSPFSWPLEGCALPATGPHVYLQQRDHHPWLLWDARIVEVRRLSNLMLVTLAALPPFFCQA
jgi:hypothetical protein